MKSVSLLGAAMAGLIVASCAAPQTTGPQLTTASISSEANHQESLILTQTLLDSQRVQNISYPIMTRNASACETKTHYLYGFNAFNNQIFTASKRPLLAQLWSLDENLKVMHVVPGSSAANAGLETGDIIAAVNGEAPPKTGKAPAWLYERIDGKQSASLTVLRDQETQNLQISGQTACDIPVELKKNNETNAYTDGSTIWLDTGLLRLASSEDELAAVISHELAHITMKHRDKKTQNQVAGAIGGAVIDIAFAAAGVNTGGAFTSSMSDASAKAYSTDFEKEADYVGAYYMANAGFDVEKSAAFWRKLALENPNSVRFAGTHPTTAERFVLLQATSSEISAKRDANAPLVPDKPERTPQVVAAKAMN